ncbi:hypothetical protein pipiens_015567 [Culex pipiens pipiens]|uniref:Uncharacterized protein n=1 Tax=Culex pipiens pipiens TaxID=38569 RepID=A0ABD1CPZ5_CULPP
MASACDYCAKHVKDDEPFIKCMGFCEGVVHMRCTKTGSLKMNTSFLKIVNECTNLFWMCDKCSKLMKITRFRTVMESVGDTQLLLLSKRVTSLSTANQSGTPKPKRTPKLTRGSDPVPSKPLVFETNALANASITCVPPEENLFRLYVTRFANHTMASQVKELVKNAIGQNDVVQVTALVKRGVDPLSLPFISFKVGVNIAHKEAISNPGNCGFREFEDLQRKTSSPQSSGDGQRAKKPMLSFAVLKAIVTPSGSTLGSPNPIGRDNEPFLTPRSGNSDSKLAAMEH